ncbi:ABC transporter permease [Bifidobacterium imperatoris]|uniref:ABC transporter permease n=1 Tax=Bifidobacterium imperatoris TaxID=2020965 RepID=A0A2N5IQC9_9BIFI|nr:ABC transporter permease [Bifidobacterium imperatoris]PLS24163.1 multidrug ABC transporter permease [Bifidobacterium imperatoris]QSY57341.1 ABC transporter permease [Bifidobacterium imperatoris]
MWSTFIVTLKANLRDKSSLFWLIVFPIALATMFNGVFGNLDQAMSITPVSVAVVEDANWTNAIGADTLITALSGKNSDTSKTHDDNGTNAVKIDPGVTLLNVTKVDSTSQARKLVTQGDTDGYLKADNDGRIALTLSDDTVTVANNGTQEAGLDVSLSALDNVLDQYNRTSATVKAVLEDNPTAPITRTFWNGLNASMNATKEVTLTNFKPSVMARYYYALMGMACLIAMSYMIHTVTTAQANLSALGIRRTVAPLGRAKQLVAGFLAGWLCSCVCLLIALAYIRYGCGIEVGGREPAAVLAVVIASFMTCAFGTMIGAIPKLTTGVKQGMSTAIACSLSLFSGLYGGFAMELSDLISRKAPLLAAINPAQQVTDLFYSLMYYDSYQPFIRTCAILLAMSAVFLAAGVIMLRRQRYEHL